MYDESVACLGEGAFFPLVFYSAARLPGSLVQVLNQTLIPSTAPRTQPNLSSEFQLSFEMSDSVSIAAYLQHVWKEHCTWLFGRIEPVHQCGARNFVRHVSRALWRALSSSQTISNHQGSAQLSFLAAPIWYSADHRCRGCLTCSLSFPPLKPLALAYLYWFDSQYPIQMFVSAAQSWPQAGPPR